MLNITEDFPLLNRIRIALNTKHMLFYSNSIYAIDPTTKSNFRYTSVNPLFGKIKDYSVFSVDDINEIGKEHKTTKKPIIYMSHNDTIVCGDYTANLSNMDISHVFSTLNDVSLVYNSIPNYSTDITNNESLMGALRSKATEPGEVCIIAGTEYFMTLFYGILRINARDSVKMDIFNYTHNSFITKFIVNKGGFDVTHIIRFLYK